MRVLLLSHMFPGRDPTFGIYIKQQAEDLKALGVQILAVTRNQKNSWSYIYYFTATFFGIWIRKYDIIHGHYGFHSALIATLFRRKPLIMTYHGSDALIEPRRNRFYYLLQRFLVSRTDHNIAVSGEIRKRLIEELGASEDKISVIPCGVNTDHFLPYDQEEARKALGLEREGKIVLYIGRLSYLKGVDILQRVAQRFPDVTFLLLGDGMLTDPPPNCRLLGKIPNKKLPCSISAANVFFLPSRSEGSPTVLKEALACGVPVVCSNVGDSADIVRDGKSGYVVQLDETGKTFVTALQRLLSDLDMSRAMGIYGQQDMVNRFNNLIIAKKILKIYQRYYEGD